MNEYLKGSITTNRKVFGIAVIVIFIAIIGFLIFLNVFKQASMDYFMSKDKAKQEIKHHKNEKDVNKKQKTPQETNDSQEIQKTLDELSNIPGQKSNQTNNNSQASSGNEEGTQKVLNELSDIPDETNGSSSSDNEQSPEEIQKTLDELNSIE